MPVWLTILLACLAGLLSAIVSLATLISWCGLSPMQLRAQAESRGRREAEIHERLKTLEDWTAKHQQWGEAKLDTWNERLEHIAEKCAESAERLARIEGIVVRIEANGKGVK